MSSDIVSEHFCRSRLFNDVLVDKAAQSSKSPLLPMALLDKSNLDIELVFSIISAMCIPAVGISLLELGHLESPRARNLQPWSPIEQLLRLSVNPLLLLEQADAKYPKRGSQ